ncbi:MAG: transcriptional repressor [Bacteroidales bacterium]|nr:transcriptional repressor [Bacteroidales bacterium]MDZ4204684.1 transcriptional repressor [Bacteroidales bacterium]
MKIEKAREVLKQAELRITPQRMAVLQAVNRFKNHPTAEQMIEYIHKSHPEIASGTVYKILDVFVEKSLLAKVNTGQDVMRYDPMLSKHHHLYCSDSHQIDDYFNDELTQIVDQFFENNQIPNFDINDIKIEIIGRYSH